jgi:hypothetical protein
VADDVGDTVTRSGPALSGSPSKRSPDVEDDVVASTVSIDPVSEMLTTEFDGMGAVSVTRGFSGGDMEAGGGRSAATGGREGAEHRAELGDSAIADTEPTTDSKCSAKLAACFISGAAFRGFSKRSAETNCVVSASSRAGSGGKCCAEFRRRPA